MPQGSVLGPLLFLIYINDLHVAIKHCKVHHFADDTNLLIINKSLKRLNKLLNIDLKNLTNWLNANKISLNVSKTELIIFKPKRKPLDFNMKIKLNGKRLYPADSVRYLGVKIDNELNWKSHINAIATKLNRANVMLYKAIMPIHPHQAGVTCILKSSPASQNSYLFTRISALSNISMSNQ